MNDYYFPKIKNYTLDNGLSVFWLPKKAINHIHIEAMFKTGSREEPIQFPGISHFLEHLIVYSPTKSFPNLKKMSEFTSKVGGWANASTYFNRIVLEGDFPIKNLFKALTLFKERLFNLKFSPKIFKSEKARIIQEIGANKDDLMKKIESLLIENQTKEKDSALRNVLGNKNLVKKMEIKDLRAYYKKIANPLNTVLIVSGPESIGERLKKELVSGWGDVKNKYKSFPKARKTNFVNFSKKHYQKEDLQEVYFAISFPLSSFSPKKEERLVNFLSYVLDFNEGSIIRKIEQRGLAYCFSGEYIILPDKLLYSFYGHTESLSKLKEIVSYLKDNLTDNTLKSLNPSFFEKAKEKYLFFYLIGLENEEDVSYYIQDHASEGKRDLDFKKEFNELKEISFNDIKDLMDKLFSKDNMNILTIGKGNNKN
jgi:predicted Zn-dependent peptidase